MIRDLLLDVPVDSGPADVCIVGAGAAGITLAVELTRRGKHVTLLEGGGRSVEPESQTPYQGCIAGLPHRGLHSGRVRALGGTTTLWGGQILELDAVNFEQRPWVAGSGWPFPKSALTGFYRRALEFEGLASAIDEDATVWERVHTRKPTFEDLEVCMSRWCPEPDFHVVHRQVLEGPSITVWTHANAVELLHSDGCVTGVRCKAQAGTEAVFRAREYCFCLGAIESCRFFLQPMDGPLPWNESGLLGRHFQDHIDCDAAVIEPYDVAAFHHLFDAIFLRSYKYNPKLKLTAEAQRERKLLQAGATFFSISDRDEVLRDVKQAARKMLRGDHNEVTGAALAQVARHFPTLLRQAYRYGFEHRAYHARDAQIRMRLHCEQEPMSASAITLCSERDELGLRRTRLSWKISEQEIHTAREFVRIATAALQRIAVVRPLTGAGAGSAQEFIEHCEDSFHHMGGMRMNPSPRGGVVDTDLRLHGTANLYVCSSAVFPASGFSNPTHTLIALAVRLADHLAA